MLPTTCPPPPSFRRPAAPLQSLLQPALAASGSSNPQAAAAAEAAIAALSRLEAARPGASRSLVGDVLAMLSVSSSPSLQVRPCCDCRAHSGGMRERGVPGGGGSRRCQHAALADPGAVR